MCEKCYIIETNRKKLTRMNEHEGDVKKVYEASNTANRTHVEKHNFDCDKSEKLLRETNWYRRIIKESLYTQETYERSLKEVKYNLKIFG